jgi:transcriptional regulator with XRE-family HTH domain
MPKPTSYGVALTKAREAAGLSQTQVAARLRTYPNTVHRWERQQTRPAMGTRIALLRMLESAPRDLLEDLAEESNVELASIGLAPPAPAVAAGSPASPSSPIPATAQTLVDDALREAAEEMNVLPVLARPALSRMLDRLARGGVPIDAAARMVLGVPKKVPISGATK